MFGSSGFEVATELASAVTEEKVKVSEVSSRKKE